MTTDNPRAWDKPISEYRAIDLVLNREQMAAAIKAWAVENDVIRADDIPENAYPAISIAGENTRIQFLWKEDDIQGELADAVDFMLRAKTPDDQKRAIEESQETLAKWKAGR